MTITSRLAQHLELMGRMFRLTGAVDGPLAVMTIEDEFRSATLRCAACTGTEACTDWLLSSNEGAEAPAFCPNHAMINRMTGRN